MSELRSQRDRNDEELKDIIREFSNKNRQATFSHDDIDEMAARYGLYGDSDYYSESSDGYLYDADYSPRPSASRASRAPKPVVDDGPVYVNGQRVIYDADMQRQREQRGVERLRTPTGTVRVIYDADSADASTAAEAPFDDFGEKAVNTEPDNSSRKSTRPSQAPHPVSKTGRKRKANKEQKEALPKRFFHAIMPSKKGTVGDNIRKIIMDVSFVVLVVSLALMGRYYYELNKAIDVNRRTIETIGKDTESLNEEEKAWAEIREKYPDVNFPEGMKSMWADLYVLNSDFAGAIEIPGTGIRSAVVQRLNDPTNDYYLRRDLLGQSTKYGTPYLDTRANCKEISQNMAIYGHHMKDGLLFAQLELYKTIDGWASAPIIQYDSPWETYYYKVYAAFITNGSASGDNGYLFNCVIPDFPSEQKYDEYIEALDARALYKTGVDLNKNDKIITLITCTYEFNDARLIVVGRMLRDGESPDVDTSLAEVNEEPLYPQKYYNAKGLSNPYKGQYRWEPFIVEVPDVVGKSRDEAVSLLEYYGFNVTVEPSAGVGTVKSQSLDAGDTTEVKSDITITLG